MKNPHPYRTLAIGVFATLWVFAYAKAETMAPLTDEEWGPRPGIDVRMPSRFHGHWCVDGPTQSTDQSGFTMTYHRIKGKRCPVEDSNDDNSVRITARRFAWPGHSCDADYRGNRGHPNQVFLEVWLRCHDENWKKRYILLERGRLSMTRVAP